jgi:hypothetical protein
MRTDKKLVAKSQGKEGTSAAIAVGEPGSGGGPSTCRGNRTTFWKNAASRSCTSLFRPGRFLACCALTTHRTCSCAVVGSVRRSPWPSGPLVPNNKVCFFKFSSARNLSSSTFVLQA